MIRRLPRIMAYMDHRKIDFSEGCHHFSELLRQLVPVSPYVHTNTLLTSEEQMESGIGLDPLNDMGEVIRVLLEEQAQGDYPDILSKYVWAERWKDSRAIVKVKYKFDGPENTIPNYLDCENLQKVSETDNFSLSHWLQIVEVIINWRRPTYLWCGDDKYWYDKHGLFYPERTITNWFCWVPQQVESSQIPSASLVRPMLEGTLIVTSDQYFNIDDEAAIHRANDVEMEMNEAGILPHLNDLMKG